MGNQIVIITGASAGIGLATAKLLRKQGAKLVLNARRADRLAEVAAELDARAVPGDITEKAVRKSVVEACEGRVDILVNNAGYAEPGAVEAVAEEAYRRQFEVNVFAVGALTQEVQPLMRERRSGRIVNISSVAGRFGYPLFGWYCASKHALEGLSDALRLEMRPWGVRVSLIEPGPVETEFFDVLKTKAEPQIADGDSPYAPFYKKAPEIEAYFMKQAVSAEEVAKVILAACTDARPKDRYAVSLMSKTSILALRLLPRSWLDRMIRREFRVPRPEDVA